MFAIIRNFNGVPVRNFTFQVEHYSWSALGGPEVSLIKVASTHAALRYCLSMLRFTVEIYSNYGGIVWWGIVNKVILQDDATRITRSLQGHANTIGAFYTDEEGDEQFTGFIKSEISNIYDRYGEKQILLDVSNRVDNQITDDQMLEILESFESIPPTMETSRGDTIGATLECVGWGHTLEWKHTPYQDRGRFGDITDYAVNPDSIEYAPIIYSPQNQFNEGRLAQYADMKMNLYRDTIGDQHFLSHVVFPMVHLEDQTPGQGVINTYGGVRVEVFSSDGADPSENEALSSPVSIIDNGSFINEQKFLSIVSRATTSIIPVEFRWPTADFSLPSDGWYFVLRSASNRAAVPVSRFSYWFTGDSSQPKNNEYLWYSVRGSTDTFGAWSAWRDQTIAGYTIPDWIHLPFEFYTRLGASALIKHIIQGHTFIRSALYPNPPSVDEKFLAYLNGRETLSTSIKNMCSVDDLFYIITPNRTLKLYEVPAIPEESNIVMKNDGTVNVRPEGDLSKVVGKWVYDNSIRGIHGLCTAARYEVRTGAYDLSFRGAPSLSEISTRVLQ